MATPLKNGSRAARRLERPPGQSPAPGSVPRTPETGTVKSWSDDRRFGFIKPDGAGEDVFVHFRAITTEGRESLSPGERVRFVVEDVGKGPRARDVEVIDAPRDDEPLTGWLAKDEPLTGWLAGEQAPRADAGANRLRDRKEAA